jgi:hypothetical protein
MALSWKSADFAAAQGEFLSRIAPAYRAPSF